jgi:hypothetical protein
MKRTSLLALCAVVIPTTMSALQAPPTNPKPTVIPSSPASVKAKVEKPLPTVADFAVRIKAYEDLRKKVDDGAPPLKETSAAGDIKVAEKTLQARMQAARAGAKHGDIFTAEITAAFRRLLRPEADKGTKAAIADDNPGADLPFKVNAAYPEKEPLSTVPVEILHSLPELPKDVEYRFGGKHLILRDARANLIVDYILNAIP